MEEKGAKKCRKKLKLKHISSFVFISSRSSRGFPFLYISGNVRKMSLFYFSLSSFLFVFVFVCWDCNSIKHTDAKYCERKSEKDFCKLFFKVCCFFHPFPFTLSFSLTLSFFLPYIILSMWEILQGISLKTYFNFLALKICFKVFF